MSTKFLLLGGFLGAGKTTLLIGAARYLRSQGYRVAAITNDQGENLIDTQRVSAQGISTEEVVNGCFCCRFEQLVDVLGKLMNTPVPPDYVLAEAVGSCTDLTATVLKPMQSVSRVQVLPLVVVADPNRIIRLFGDNEPRGFTRDLQYLYRLQLTEASLIALSKTDIIAPALMKHSQEILTQHFPEKPIIEIAEYDEPLIAALLGKIDQLSVGRSLTINYDRYADAEAAMGWFDGSFSISIDDPTTTRHFMTDWLDRLAREVRQAGGDIGHVKVAINTHDRRILVNVVSADSPGQFQESSVEGLLKAGSVNARVALPADLLERLLTATAAHAAKEYGVELYWQSQRAFAPSRPVPTHRMS